MLPIFLLTLRQIAGGRRLAIVGLLTALPVALALVLRLTDSVEAAGAPYPKDFVDGFIGGLLASVMLPITTLALATPAFGGELEDRTLSYLTLKPIARWRIALPKLAAPMLVAAPFATVSGMLSCAIALEPSPSLMLSVGASLLVGVVAYSAIFGWAGIMTSRALAAGVVYVFVWEAAIGSLLEGAGYLSVRGYTLAIMRALDAEGLSALGEQTIELPAAIVGAIVATVAFFALTVWRLKRMDVP